MQEYGHHRKAVVIEDAKMSLYLLLHVQTVLDIVRVSSALIIVIAAFAITGMRRVS